MEIIVYQIKISMQPNPKTIISMQPNPKKEKKQLHNVKQIFFLHFFSSFHINLYGSPGNKNKMKSVSKAKNRLNAHLFFG